MAFIVEDGTGVSSANAYISVQYFKDYHDDRGNDYSALTSDTAIQQVIVRATDYIQTRFSGSFVGWVDEQSDQGLSWPREGAYYENGQKIDAVPKEVMNATAEYALRAISGPLAPDISYDSTNAPIVEREERAGPIVERYKFGGGGITSTYRKYPLADNMLNPVLEGYGSSYLLRA